VDLRVTVKDSVKADTYTLRINGAADSSTVSPVDVRIKVVD
jgi:hypothetical protein